MHCRLVFLQSISIQVYVVLHHVIDRHFYLLLLGKQVISVKLLTVLFGCESLVCDLLVRFSLGYLSALVPSYFLRIFLTSF